VLNPSVYNVVSKAIFKRALLFIVLCVLLLKGINLTRDLTPPVDDFIEYWSASRLLLAGKNPYSTAELNLLQRPLTGSETPLIMWNPPWTLSLLMPFGLLEYSASRWLWLILNFGLLLLSTHWLWDRYVRWEGASWLATGATLVLTITFLPGMVVLSLGQIGALILAGIVGFLGLVRREQYFKAGAMTLLISLKPQLLFLFWILLLFWVLKTRRWTLVAGAVTALVLALSLPLWLCSDLISGYLRLAASESIFHHPSTTTGALLRWVFGWENVWLQVLPMVPGIFWAALYWKRHCENWDWDRRMPLVLLVSVVTTCYGWIFDQAVLYPALFQAVAWLFRAGPKERFVAVASYGLLNLAGLVLIRLGFNGVAYVWMAPAWIILHWFASGRAQPGEKWGVSRRKRHWVGIPGPL
jgi:Glycosyltransferase family 87